MTRTYQAYVVEQQWEAGDRVAPAWRTWWYFIGFKGLAGWDTCWRRCVYLFICLCVYLIDYQYFCLSFYLWYDICDKWKLNYCLCQHSSIYFIYSFQCLVNCMDGETIDECCWATAMLYFGTGQLGQRKIWYTWLAPEQCETPQIWTWKLEDRGLWKLTWGWVKTYDYHMWLYLGVPAIQHPFTSDFRIPTRTIDHADDLYRFV